MFISVILEQGELPQTVAGGSGLDKSLADYFIAFSAMAQRLGLRPLGDFYTDYSEELEAIVTNEDLSSEEIDEATSRIGVDGPWFDPEEGLPTIRSLIQHLESLPANEAEDLEGPLMGLRTIASELDYAKRHESRFHLAYHE